MGPSHFCSVLFRSSRWHLCALKSPYAHNVAFETVPMFVWRWPSLVLSGKIVYRFFFPRLSPPGDRWCDVLGFVTAGSVSSSSTLLIFQEASHLWGLLCPPVYHLGNFLSLWHVQSSTPTAVFEGGRGPLTRSSLGFSLLNRDCMHLVGTLLTLTTDGAVQHTTTGARIPIVFRDWFKLGWLAVVLFLLFVTMAEITTLS